MSLKMMFSSAIHLPANDKISFFMAEYNSIVYKYDIFLIHSPVVEHLGYFLSLAIVNNAAINMVCASVFIVIWLTFLQVYA
jgi:hypothetical protein